MKTFLSALCLLASGIQLHAALISDYANTASTLTNDLFIIERPGVDDFNIAAKDMAAAIGALKTNSPLPSANLSGFVPNTVLSNVTATFVSTLGTNYGAFNRNFTNTLSTNLWVQMTNATATAVFNRLGTNVIPSTVNPTVFPLSVGMWLTNATGGGYWYTP
jgi:hypothetical protein